MAPRKKQSVSAAELDRILIRLPDGMRQMLETIADGNGRSMTAEVVAALEQHFARPSLLDGMAQQINMLRRDMHWASQMIDELQYAKTDIYRKLGQDEPPYYPPRPSETVENPPE